MKHADARALLALFDAQMRRDAPPDSPGTRVEHFGGKAGGPGETGGSGGSSGAGSAAGSGGAVVRQTGAATHDWTGVLWSDLTEADADAAIREQVRWLESPEGRGREFEWKLYSHDRPADLGERLRAAGFEPEPPETLMIADVAALPTEVRLPEGVRLAEVTDRAGVELVVRAHEEAFRAPAGRLRDRLLEQVGRPDLTMVVALAGDEPVSAARMELHAGTSFASLWGGGTVPGWRGRGIYRALVAHRTRIAADRGVRYLQVDASDQSRPILERLGFAALSVTTPYLRQG